MPVHDIGNRFKAGLSTDTKPSLQDGWLFIETDTFDIFQRQAGAWVRVSTLSHDRMDDVSASDHHAAVDGVPQNAILMWHGTIASIPSGWVICDGNNGTPNLLARFVQGVATAATNPGSTGGSSTHTHDDHTDTSPDGRFDFSASGNRAHTAPTTHSADNHRPLFFDIAFIMKT